MDDPLICFTYWILFNTMVFSLDEDYCHCKMTTSLHALSLDIAQITYRPHHLTAYSGTSAHNYYYSTVYNAKQNFNAKNTLIIRIGETIFQVFFPNHLARACTLWKDYGTGK